MGRKFIETTGAAGELFGCKKCLSYITSQQQMTSPHFNGSTGPATLFRQAWNLRYGVLEKRKMTTGWHVVRDVFCINCETKLGWMYEMALERDQMYKETQVILENALFVAISDPIDDPLKEDDKKILPNIEQPRNRSPAESIRASRSNSESSSSFSTSFF